jgi:hypothetical protein
VNFGREIRVQYFEERPKMIQFVLWLILFVICWPLALLGLVLYPIVWLLLLPFRIIGIAVGGVLELVWVLITMPARFARRLS